MKTFAGILFASLLLFSGCKKKEAPPATGSGSGSPTEMGSGSAAGSGSDMGSAAGSGSDLGSAAGSGSAGSAGSAAGSGSADAGSAAAAGGSIKDAADYETRGMAMIDKFTGIVAAAGTDCPKLAKDVNAFVDENQAFIADSKAFEKANPAAKKAFDEKMKPKMKDMQAKMMPAFKACAKDKDVQAAMKRFDAK